MLAYDSINIMVIDLNSFLPFTGTKCHNILYDIFLFHIHYCSYLRGSCVWLPVHSTIGSRHLCFSNTQSEDQGSQWCQASNCYHLHNDCVFGHPHTDILCTGRLSECYKCFVCIQYHGSNHHISHIDLLTKGYFLLKTRLPFAPSSMLDVVVHTCYNKYGVLCLMPELSKLIFFLTKTNGLNQKYFLPNVMHNGISLHSCIPGHSSPWFECVTSAYWNQYSTVTQKWSTRNFFQFFLALFSSDD